MVGSIDLSETERVLLAIDSGKYPGPNIPVDAGQDALYFQVRGTCGQAVYGLTVAGKTPVARILSCHPLQEALRIFLETGNHNLPTITSYVGGPYSEAQILFSLQRMLERDKITQINIGGTEYFSVKKPPI